MAVPIYNEKELQEKLKKESRDVKIEHIREFLQGLIDMPHDYASCVYAIAAAANAAARIVSDKLGITGFQASLVFWEINKMGNWMHLPGPARILDYDNLLYPQYESKFRTIDLETWEWVQKEAKSRLGHSGTVNDRVRKHWEQIVSGKVPFNLVIRD